VTGKATVTAGAVGLLVKTYPKISETFILEEILGFERHGLRLHIFSLRRPSDAMSHAATKAVRAPVSYLAPDGVRDVTRVLAAHVALIVMSPRRYLKTLLFLLRREEPARARAFLQAGCLAHELSKAGIAHLHAHFASEPAGVAELVSKLAPISYSISAHAKDIYLSPPGSLRRKIRGARFTVTCTEYNRVQLTGIAGPEATVLRMYHGVDLCRFRPEQGRDAQADRPLILSVGRLRAKKGFAVLIEACRLLRDAGIAMRCQIVGYGEEHDRLHSLISRHALDDTVQLSGKMTHDDLIELYRQTAVFALPCQVESDGDRDGIPNVLLEALAMEIAVVSTSVSGIPEVIQDGVNGVLIAPHDAKALADAIRRLLDSQALRKRLGLAGRQTVANRFCNDVNLETVRELLLVASSGADSGMCNAAHGAVLCDG
jgi:glycosyltransferase involved in cell wall biosynthesis